MRVAFIGNTQWQEFSPKQGILGCQALILAVLAGTAGFFAYYLLFGYNPRPTCCARYAHGPLPTIELPKRGS